MAFSLMDVPLNGEGLGNDLNQYGFAKTFTSQGSDQFDAIIEVNTGVGYCPVGRIKGQSVIVVKAWGYDFRLRRLDDGTQSPPVTVSVQAPTSRLAMLSGAGLLVPGVDLEIPLLTIQEPVTLTCNAASYGEVLVLGKSATGDLAPIGRLTTNSLINVDSLVDISAVVFRLVRSEDPGAGINVNIWGKAQSESQSVFALTKLAIIGTGINVLYSSPYAEAVVNEPGIVHVAPGIFDVPFNIDLPTNNPLCFCAVDPGVGAIPDRWTLNVRANSIAVNAIRLEILDGTGAHVDTGQLNVYVQVLF